MARIIHTNPKKIRRRVNLRVVFSFLLFMQIQLPNAREVQQEKVTDLSFYLAAKNTRQLSFSHKEAKTPVTTLALNAK